MSLYTVYSRDGCTFCERAIDLLEGTNEAFVTIKCKDVADMKDRLRTTWSLPEDVIQNVRTFPQILHDGNLVGGYFELYNIIRNEANTFSTDAEF
jgi:glutaredoxin